MATSFLGQGLAVEYILQSAGKLPGHTWCTPTPCTFLPLGALLSPCTMCGTGKLPAGCTNLPEELDDQIASMQLTALHVAIDVPTKEQREYARSWAEGVHD